MQPDYAKLLKRLWQYQPELPKEILDQGGSSGPAMAAEPACASPRVVALLLLCLQLSADKFTRFLRACFLL